MKAFSRLAAILCTTLLVSSCALLSPREKLTSDYTPREGQAVWFTDNDLTVMARRIASCISASEMVTDYQRAKHVYAEYMRLTYETISEKGADVDGGVRALNFIKRLHKQADGSSRLWKESVELAKKTDDESLKGLPIPPDYD